MIKNKKILLIIILISLIIEVPYVNAFTFGVQYADTGEGGNTKKEPDPIPLGTKEEGGKLYKYYCNYTYELTNTNNITINGYNNEKSIMNSSLKISQEDRISSGTPIKLNIHETKTIGYRVTSAKATVDIYTPKTCYYYDCTYTNKSSGGGFTPLPKPGFEVGISSITLFSRIQRIAVDCSYHNVNDQLGGCPDYALCNKTSTYSHQTDCSTSEDNVDASDTNYQEDCEKEAAKKAIAAANKLFYNSYQIRMPDSNDINGTNHTSLNVSSPTGGFTGTEPSGSKTVVYTYSIGRVCMNKLNAIVRYTNDNECNDDEIEVENKTINGKSYWNYFMPLNAKSNQELVINLRPIGKSGDLVEKQCRYVMENNPITGDDTKTSYLDLIIKKDETNFNGDYALGTRGLDAKEIQDNGCLLTSKIKIPAVQEFYNEIKSGTSIKLKGFNFYYKPIDINNPFPNGISDNSLWKEWSELTNKTPNLTESYSTRTYTALNINANVIRNYNQNNLYTDWSNMNSLDGTSSFVDDYVHRNETTDIYKLGCGPLNKEWSDCN